MARQKARTVKTGEAHVVECQPRRQGRHGVYAVAGGTRALAVAARAKVSRTCCLDAMVANEVPVVDQVIVRRRRFGCEVDVASVAVA
jgi:hypothetical protein